MGIEERTHKAKGPGRLGIFALAVLGFAVLVLIGIIIAGDFVPSPYEELEHYRRCRTNMLFIGMVADWHRDEFGLYPENIDTLRAWSSKGGGKIPWNASWELCPLDAKAAKVSYRLRKPSLHELPYEILLVEIRPNHKIRIKGKRQRTKGLRPLRGLVEHVTEEEAAVYEFICSVEPELAPGLALKEMGRSCEMRDLCLCVLEFHCWPPETQWSASEYRSWWETVQKLALTKPINWSQNIRKWNFDESEAARMANPVRWSAERFVVWYNLHRNPLFLSNVIETNPHLAAEAAARRLHLLRSIPEVPDDDVQLRKWINDNAPYLVWNPRTEAIELDMGARRAKVRSILWAEIPNEARNLWDTFSKDTKVKALEDSERKVRKRAKLEIEAWQALLPVEIWELIPEKQREKWDKLDKWEKWDIIVKAEKEVA